MQTSEMLSLNALLSETRFPVMAGAALTAIILTAIALPLGVMGLAGFLYLYFLCRPLLQPLGKAGQAVSPAEGVILSIGNSTRGSHIRIQQRWDARLSIAMPIAGRIEQNLFIDGTYLHANDGAFDAMNARRELLIETADGDVFEIVQWGTPFSRLLLSSALEGQLLEAGTACGLNIFAGVVEVIIPETYSINVSEGSYAVAGQTVLAQQTSA